MNISCRSVNPFLNVLLANAIAMTGIKGLYISMLFSRKVNFLGSDVLPDVLMCLRFTFSTIRGLNT